MPSLYLFHQNLKRFGGASAERNNRWHEALIDVRGSITQDAVILAGGFTEVMNGTTAMQAMRGAGGLCSALGLEYISTVNVGKTAGGYSEWITVGIGVNVDVLRLARVFVRPASIARTPLFDYAMNPNNPDPHWAATIPDEAAGDYRAIVCLWLRNRDPLTRDRIEYIVVGFTHNMYTRALERTRFMNQLPYVFGNLAANSRPGSPLVVGGDFNVAASTSSRRGSSRLGICRAYAQGLDPNDAQQGGVHVGATEGGTTWNGRLYDYWYVRAPGGFAFTPLVRSRTLDGGASSGQPLSDHTAILLRLL